jgi:putative FmdB family regulatory protein
MPIYLYQCDSCGVRFERQQRISEDPLVDCPECDGRVHRVIQPVGIIFKGSGFYVTDNRSGSSSTLTPPKEGDKSDDKKDGGNGQASTTEGKTEPRSAATADSAQKSE